MKINIFSLIFIILQANWLGGQENENIVRVKVQITSNLYNFILSQYHFYAFEKSKIQLQELNNEIDSVLKEINNSDQTQLIDYFAKQKTLLNSKYVELTQLHSKIDTSVNLCFQYLDSYFATLHQIQKNFAKKIDIENQQAKDFNFKMLEIGNLIFYYNSVLKIYLEKNFIEKNLVKSIENQDTLNLLKHYNSLIAYSSQLREKLMQVELYKGDPILKFACQKSYNVTIGKLKSQIPALIEKYQQISRLEQEQNQYLSIPKNKRTKTQRQEIEKLTTNIKEQKADLTIKQDEIKQIISKNEQDWQQTTKKFFEKYFPK